MSFNLAQVIINATETITLENDITVFYVAATSFPEGITVAHQKLHSMVPFSVDRKYFGISRPENGRVVYFAGTEETFPNEAQQYGLHTLILKKGNYISVVLKDYMKNVLEIGCTFKELLQQPDIDLNGYCVEWYISDKDMRCMVRVVH